MPEIHVYTKEQADVLLGNKQATLVGSGTGQNIKTINSTNIMGTGDIPVQAPLVVGTNLDDVPTQSSTNPVTSGGVFTSLSGKFNVNDMYTTTGQGASAGISAQDPIAMKGWVNSSIATNTATFRGTYDVVTDLGLTTAATHSEVATALGTYMAGHSITPTNNDYCFVTFDLSQDPGNVDRYDRYKFTDGSPGAWDYEYTLNNSSFTSEQWSAINSGINSTKVGVYDGYATSKQDTLVAGTNMDTAPTQNSTYPVTSGGVYSAINTLSGQCAKLNASNSFSGANTFLSTIRVDTSVNVGSGSEVPIFDGRASLNGVKEDSVGINQIENADNSSDFKFYRRDIVNGQRVWNVTNLSDIAKCNVDNTFTRVNIFTSNGGLSVKITQMPTRDTQSTTQMFRDIHFRANNDDTLGFLRFEVGANNRRSLNMALWNPTTQEMVWKTLAEIFP